jgi:hypothetical protein
MEMEMEMEMKMERREERKGVRRRQELEKSSRSLHTYNTLTLQDRYGVVQLRVCL